MNYEEISKPTKHTKYLQYFLEHVFDDSYSSRSQNRNEKIQDQYPSKKKKKINKIIFQFENTFRQFRQ